MTTINEISNHIMGYFDGTLDAFGYTAQSVNEISNPEESEAWDKFLEENQWKIYPLLANIMQVFLPTGNYQLFYTQYPQGFISIIAKPHDK